jgi:hypothetical protein
MAMSGRTIVEPSGLSVLAVDPGTCTGWALLDGRSGRLLYDQWYGVNGVDTNLTKYKIRTTKSVTFATLSERELRIACKLCDLVWLAGPKTAVVFEDFILGNETGGRGGYGTRTGLSPVRITAMFQAVAHERGIWTGDAWRVRNCGLLGLDPRGYHVGSDAASVWWESDVVARLRLKVFQEGTYGGEGASWVVPQSTSIKGSIPCSDDALKACGMWVPGKEHARDAMRHMRYFTRGLGLRIKSNPEWFREVMRQKSFPT